MDLILCYLNSEIIERRRKYTCWLLLQSNLLRASLELIKGDEREGFKRSLLVLLMLLPLSRKGDTTHITPLVFRLIGVGRHIIN